MKACIFAAIAILLAANRSVFSFSELEGVLASDTTLGDTIFITAELTISEGVSLTLEPGARVISPQGIRIIVNGGIVAAGTEEAQIVFEGYSDEKWAGISIIESDDSSKFVFCTIKSGLSIDKYGVFFIKDSPNITIEHCTFSSNQGGLYGGALTILSSDISITNSIVDGNSTARGGGIFISSCSPLIRECTFSNNSCNIMGGGACLSGSGATFDSCTFVNNSAVSNSTLYGGGVFADGAAPRFMNCAFQNNSAKSNADEVYLAGGGICLLNGKPVISGCSFTGNKCSPSFSDGRSFGGAIYSEVCSLTIERCRIADNSTGGDSSFGGGVCLNKGDFHLRATEIRTNSASCGGGFCTMPGGKGTEALPNRVTVDSCSFVGNGIFLDWRSANGAGLRLEKCVLSMKNSNIEGNTASCKIYDGLHDSYTYGGGIMLQDCESDFFRCTIINNTSTAYAEEYEAKSFGGGICVKGGRAIFSLCDITGNRAVSEGKVESNKPRSNGGSACGGAAYTAEASVHFGNCNIDSNRTVTNTKSNLCGGAFFLSQSECVITHCVVTKNNSGYEKNLAEARGGALYQSISDIRCIGSVFGSNIADLGGAVFVENPNDTLEINASTFSDNQASHVASELYLDGYVTVTGSVIHSSAADTGLFYLVLGGETKIGYSCVTGGMAGFRGTGSGEAYHVFNYKSNIESDPLLTDPAAGDFTLKEGSPCINNGPEDTAGLTAGTSDIRGIVRICDGRIDIGACEYGTLGVRRAVLSGFRRASNICFSGDRIRIDAYEPVRITLFDLNGRKIMRTTAAPAGQAATIPLQGLSSTVSLLEVRSIKSGRILALHKFIVNR